MFFSNKIHFLSKCHQIYLYSCDNNVDDLMIATGKRILIHFTRFVKNIVY